MVLTAEEQDNIRKAVDEKIPEDFGITSKLVDVRANAAIHREAVPQSGKRSYTVRLHEALRHELPASGEACPETES